MSVMRGLHQLGPEMLATPKNLPLGSYLPVYYWREERTIYLRWEGRRWDAERRQYVLTLATPWEYPDMPDEVRVSAKRPLKHRLPL